jgi:DNA-binding beta-propeller fold protein YncE
MKWKLILTTAIVGAALALPSGSSAAPFVYVTNKGNDTVSQYDTGAGGVLVPLAPPVPASKGPSEVAVSPDGRNVYVVNNGKLADDPDDVEASVSQYDIGTDGTLSPKSPPSIRSCGASVNHLAVSPDGRSVYVPTMFDCDLIDQYDIGPYGALSFKVPPFVEPDPNSVPIAVAVSPDSRSVYVTDSRSDGPLVLQYDAAPGGELSPKSPPAVRAGSGFHLLRDIAASPDGKSVYVTDDTPSGVGGSVLQYSVGSGGKLSPKSPARVAAGTAPVFAITVSPDGRSAYVGASYGGKAAVFQYDVGPGGALSPKSPSRVLTGANAVPGAGGDVAVSPDGRDAYVAQIGSVAQYDIRADGTLSPKSPALVVTPHGAWGVAVSPVPTTKHHCKRGGWRRFGFKNQGRCIAFVRHGPK